MIDSIIKAYLKRSQLVVNEIDSKAVLKEYGIPVNKTVLAGNAEQAGKKAAEIGFPVALKVVSDEITHKTDVGGVSLNIASRKQVEKEFGKIVARAKKAVPKARIQGVSVQAMIDAGNVELIIGKKEDNVFGPVLLFGAGGIATEVFGDKSIGLPPLNRRLARKMIENTKIHRLLKGRRPRLKAKLSGLEAMLVDFSRFSLDFPEIEEVDINPVIVSRGKFYAVDARIVLSKNV